MADRSPSQPDDHGLHVITLMVKVTVGDFLWPKDAGFFSGMICRKMTTCQPCTWPCRQETAPVEFQFGAEIVLG